MSSRDSNAAISLHAFLNILRCWKQASFVRCEGRDLWELESRFDMARLTSIGGD